MFLDMTEVTAYCKVTSAADQAQLELDARTACQMVIDACGPIEATPVTEVVRSTGYYAPLMYPATAITAVAGLTDLTGLTVVPGGVSGGLPYGSATITYTAGYAEVPEWARTAAMAYTKWLWQGKLGGKQGSGVDYRGIGDRAIAGHRLGPRP